MLPRSVDGGELPDEAPIAVKEAELPYQRFRTPAGDTVDSILGPEMKSTGEVMGFDKVFGTAFAKSQAAAYGSLPTKGTVFVSIANRDKRAAIFPVKRLHDLGFRILATSGDRATSWRRSWPATSIWCSTRPSDHRATPDRGWMDTRSAPPPYRPASRA
jgi:carbamoyl-phosphate synthase large subunit